MKRDLYICVHVQVQTLDNEDTHEESDNRDLHV